LHGCKVLRTFYGADSNREYTTRWEPTKTHGKKSRDIKRKADSYARFIRCAQCDRFPIMQDSTNKDTWDDYQNYCHRTDLNETFESFDMKLLGTALLESSTMKDADEGPFGSKQYQSGETLGHKQRLTQDWRAVGHEEDSSERKEDQEIDYIDYDDYSMPLTSSIVDLSKCELRFSDDVHSPDALYTELIVQIEVGKTWLTKTLIDKTASDFFSKLNAKKRERKGWVEIDPDTVKNHEEELGEKITGQGESFRGLKRLASKGLNKMKVFGDTSGKTYAAENEPLTLWGFSLDILLNGASDTYSLGGGIGHQDKVDSDLHDEGAPAKHMRGDESIVVTIQANVDMSPKSNPEKSIDLNKVFPIIQTICTSVGADGYCHLNQLYGCAKAYCKNGDDNQWERMQSIIDSGRIIEKIKPDPIVIVKKDLSTNRSSSMIAGFVIIIFIASSIYLGYKIYVNYINNQNNDGLHHRNSYRRNNDYDNSNDVRYSVMVEDPYSTVGLNQSSKRSSHRSTKGKMQHYSVDISKTETDQKSNSKTQSNSKTNQSKTFKSNLQSAYSKKSTN